MPAWEFWQQQQEQDPGVRHTLLGLHVVWQSPWERETDLRWVCWVPPFAPAAAVAAASTAVAAVPAPAAAAAAAPAAAAAAAAAVAPA